MSTLLRDARFYGDDRRYDVYLTGGRIVRIALKGTLEPGDAEIVDLDGRFVGPGLWDEHVHFTQWVTQRSRLDLSGTGSAADVLALVARTLRESPLPAGTALTGYGFRDALWPDAPTLRELDAVAGDTPVVLVSGDLHCGWVSSGAAARIGLRLDESGVLREGPWIAALHDFDETKPGFDAYAEAASAAARRGVVGVVDFENADNATEWPARVAAGVTSLRVEASVWPERLDAAVAAGLRTGVPLDGESGLVTMGRLKVIVDGSLNTRTALCWEAYPGVDPLSPHACGVATVAPEKLADLLRTAARYGIAAAVHAIGDRANSEVIDVFERLGLPGVIEHAQLVGEHDFVRFARLGLVASVQPEHAMDDRDVADALWAGRTGRAFAYGSLHAAGATLRLGSDAPVAPLDPWLAIAAATARSRDGREAWHPEQCLPVDVAMAASARGRTDIKEGETADLVILDEDPLAAGPERLREMPVAGTLLGGRWTWRDL
ncbi:amidohydrolase [Winogradskya consettensis]|uniref:Amidohydrolase n=1 Tax=Winogradskya consettensis TaxID=113560 RepID=A0A919VXQ0_9ACTN|nr:amidohydrolase family protein [Actinoplanes consettensis]GIM79602.1 amidohydrolase [Actinoplanes consettensis]